MFSTAFHSPAHNLKHPSRLSRRRQRASLLVESLEQRTLMAATLFVTAPGVPSDDTHYQTLQSALSFASPGDTIVLQPGFSAGNFASGVMNGSAFAGGISFMSATAFEVSEVVSIGAGTTGDPVEQNLVVAVTPSLFGGFIVTLAAPLQFNHDGSPVNAQNPDGSGPVIGINKAVTIVTEGNADMSLSFNLRVWGDTAGVVISPHIFTPENPAPPPPPPPPPPGDPTVTPETITLTPRNLSLVQGGGGNGSVARFTVDKVKKASDFTASVTFSDGVTLTGRVRRVCGGAEGFEVLVNRRFSAPGNITFTVNVTGKSGSSASANGNVAVTPRVLTSQGINVTTDAKALRCVTVATFSDNLRNFCGPQYRVSITWSDGLTTGAVICRNGEGTFSVKASRPLSGPGTLTGNVLISTCDNQWTTSSSFTLTVVAPAARGRR